jgi:hypothetical protein
MAGDPLLDIALATETVAGLTVTGVSLRGVAKLMRRFDVLADLFAGGVVESARIIDKAPDAIAAVLAAAIGRPGDEAAEKKLDDLPLGTQAELLDAAIRLTFPGGIGPFKDRLVQLASSLTVAQLAGDGAAPASPDQSSS